MRGRALMKSINQWERQMYKSSFKIQGKQGSTKCLRPRKKLLVKFFSSVGLKETIYYCCCSGYCFYQGMLVFLITYLDAFDTFFKLLPASLKGTDQRVIWQSICKAIWPGPAGITYSVEVTSHLFQGEQGPVGCPRFSQWVSTTGSQTIPY